MFSRNSTIVDVFPALYRHRIKHIEMILVQWEKANNSMF